MQKSKKVLRTIEHICGSMLKGFGPQEGGGFSFQMTFKSASKTNCDKACNVDRVGGVLQPPPRNKVDFGVPVGGIREGKPHTLQSPAAKAYGVSGFRYLDQPPPLVPL